MIKRYVTYLFLFCFSLAHKSGFAQIILETSYPAASSKFYMVNLETSGTKYVYKNDAQGNRFLKFYNLDHSLWKTINCNVFPTTQHCGNPNTQYFFDALYISENLFDCDNSIEFMYVSLSDCKWFTGVYKEDGSALLFADSCAPIIKINVPQQHRPIYNTIDGTKMILSHKNGRANVYALPCSLSTDIDDFLVKKQDHSNFKAYPNPSYYETTIEYMLPNGVDQAEFRIYDMNGAEISKHTVDNNFSNLLISNRDVTPGTYLYSLVVKGQVIETKKIILLK
jgi:hypothetical protein